jgi:hypothetical protein
MLTDIFPDERFAQTFAVLLATHEKPFDIPVLSE